MLDISRFEAYKHYSVFHGFQTLQIDRASFLSGLLQLEQQTGMTIAFVDVNGYPIERNTPDGINDIVLYNETVLKTSNCFIILPKGI